MAAGVGHAGAAEHLHESLLNDSFFHVEGQLAAALLGGAPADAVRKPGNILNLFDRHPGPFLGDGGGPWLQPCATRHMFCTSWVNAMSGNLLNVFDGAPCPGWRPVLARCRRG